MGQRMSCLRMEQKRIVWKHFIPVLLRKMLMELYSVNLPEMKQSKMPTGKYEPKRSQDCLNLTKTMLRIIVELLTGYCRINFHLEMLE